MYIEAGQEAILDDEVDIVDKVKCPSTLNIALGGKVMAGLYTDGTELGLQCMLESWRLQAMLKGICGEGDKGLWGAGDAGGMPAGADGLVGASS